MNYIPKLDCSADIPQRDESRDLTVVIAHRGAPIGLWATIESAEAQLRDSGLNYDFVIVHNGEDKQPEELIPIFKHLKNSGKCLDWITVERPMSPPDARQMGSDVADGRYIYFADNHVVFAPNYFTSSIKTFEKYGADTVHSVTRFYAGEKAHLEYKLKPRIDFWAESKMVDKVEATEPYRIAAGGHGGFAVRRLTWQRLGGYGPPGLFQNYAGEELYWDLKLAMHDGTNYMDPDMVHHHWSGKRVYSRHFTEDYFRNLMVCAYVIAGEEYVNDVFRHFEHHLKAGTTPMYKLYEQAIKHSAPHKKQLEASRSRSFDEQLEYFKEHNIPF